MPPFELEQFAKTVTDGIAFPAKRQALKEELLEHMEDVYEQNLATGMDEETAAQDAVKHMGDPIRLRGTFAKLYPMSPAKLVSDSIKNLLWGIWIFYFSAVLQGYSPFGYFHRLIAIALCCSGLFYIRKISRRLSAAFWIQNIGAAVFSAGLFLQQFFVLPVEAMYIMGSIQNACMILMYILLFLDFAVQGKKEKQERDISPDEALHPLRGCIGMLSAHALFLAGSALGIMEFGALFGIFGAFLLLAVTVLHVMPADRLYMRAETEKRIRAPRRKARAYSLALLVIALCSIGGATLSAVRQPKIQPPIFADSKASDAEIAAARAHMLSLGFPQDMLNDLPDSEILRYKDALLMVDDSSQAHKLTDLSYIAYGFYLPETETQPHRLRYILRISESEALNTQFRGGIYVTDRWKNDAVSEYAIPSSEFDGTFYRILCEKDGKTVEIPPFYQKNPTCAADLEEPYGCEFGYLRNAQNTRIYFAATVLTNAFEPAWVPIDFYQLGTPFLQNNTRAVTALTLNENTNSLLPGNGYSKAWLDLSFLGSDATETAEETA